MKQLNIYIIYFIIMLLSLQAYSQNNGIKGYSIEGDEIIFTFNREDYNKISNDGHYNKHAFEDLNIENVVVSGSFNNWSKDQWQMKKIDNNTYELRKSLDDFSDAFTWEFKYVINNKYWAEPDENHVNITDAKKNGVNLDVYNLKLFSGAYPDSSGNVRFRLRGYENAKKVILSGTFNKWNEHLFKMYKIKNGWEIILNLKPNHYQYKFIVDGEWMHDPSNPDKVENEHNSYNSHIDVKKYVEFKLNGYKTAKKVVLSGSFNDWDEDGFIMKQSKKGHWIVSIPLSGGKYHYKFIIDNKWVLDPVNKVKEYDNRGNINSVCMVK